MKRVVLPMPPSPYDPAMADPMSWARAMFDHMVKVQGLLEDASRVNDVPLGQALIVGAHTLQNTVTGTTTGTDLSNFVATMAQAFTDRGLLSPTIGRSTSA